LQVGPKFRWWRCEVCVDAGQLPGVDLTSAEHVRFCALFEAHYAAVFRYARRRVADDLAADVASEVFVVAWRRLGEVPLEPLPWLYGVARRVVANQRRGQERALRLSERVAVHAGAAQREQRRRGDPGEAVTASVSFATAFGRLSVDDREVLALVAWEGLGAREVAAVLGCSVAAVTMRVHRARRRLRGSLACEIEEDWDGPVDLDSA
jgi:RNA polymerase sigma-70 factor (ECF subfamily)